MSTGSPSRAAKSTPWRDSATVPTRRSTFGCRVCGTATPWPIPVEPSSSRLRIARVMLSRSPSASSTGLVEALDDLADRVLLAGGLQVHDDRVAYNEIREFHPALPTLHLTAGPSGPARRDGGRDTGRGATPALPKRGKTGMEGAATGFSTALLVPSSRLLTGRDVDPIRRAALGSRRKRTGPRDPRGGIDAHAPDTDRSGGRWLGQVRQGRRRPTLRDGIAAILHLVLVPTQLALDLVNTLVHRRFRR